jgi:hypothetical protein
MSHKLGVAIKDREAFALFGRADALGEGALSCRALADFFLTDADRLLLQRGAD